MKINIKQIPNGKWNENCYIVNNVENDALIIDPGSDEKSIITYIELNKFNVIAILNTHAHYDHIGAISSLKDKFSVPFFLHSNDKKLLKSANLYATLFEGSEYVLIPTVEYYYDQIDIQDHISGFSINVLFTPGHTSGSVCLLIENFLFTGDTLLNGKVGRSDLPGGDEQTLKESLRTISKLPKHIIIYPGHNASSTIGNEIKYIQNSITTSQWD